MHRNAYISPGAESVIHRLPAGLKFAVTICLVVAISLTPIDRAALLIIPTAMLLVAMIISRVPTVAFLKRLLLREPFVLGGALMALFTPAPRGGPELFGFLMLRCTLGLATLILFSAITPFNDMLLLFRRLRVPQLLVTTLALMHRYLFVLGEESARMKRARASRTFVPARGLAWRTGSTIVAQLFLRASMRADRIYAAMCARGWGATEPLKSRS
jgi:cobalt/nickel transport system permease protein